MLLVVPAEISRPFIFT